MNTFPRWVVCAIFIFIVVLFCARNLPWHLDDLDQAKQAYTSFEMVERNHWWFQHTPTQRIATKPPLAGWISAAIYGATRWWDGAWRIPSLASALVILALLKRAGDRALPGIGGIVAGGTFALNLMTPRLATLVRTDMLLGCFIFAAGLMIYTKVQTGSRWATRDRWIFFALILGSMMVKGPIAYAFLLPGLIGYLFIERRRDFTGAAWCGWWPWFLPLLMFLGWIGEGIWRDPEFYNQVVQKEFLGRFDVSYEPVHKHQPFYFYATHLLRDLMPWSALLIGLVCLKNVRRALMRDPAALWLVCWTVGGLIFMSLVPSKRADRIFPVIAPIALLLVHALREMRYRKIAIACLSVAALISSSYAAFNVAKSYRDRAGALVSFGNAVRDYAGANDARFEITSSKDEGMLLYLRKTEFMKWREARAGWEAGEIDALVLPERDYAKAKTEIENWELRADTGIVPEKSNRYFLIVRRAATVQPAP